MIGPFVFLDIDGVLNAHVSHSNGYCGLDPASVHLFNKILDATDAKVVVVSAWRYFVLRGEMNIVGLNGLLCTHGLKWGCIVDTLGPDISDGNGGADRGTAVKDWFQQRFCISHKTPYVIFDDDDLGYTVRRQPFYKCDGSKGLVGTMSLLEYERTVAILMGKETYGDCT